MLYVDRACFMKSPAYTYQYQFALHVYSEHLLYKTVAFAVILTIKRNKFIIISVIYGKYCTVKVFGKIHIFLDFKAYIITLVAYINIESKLF